MGSWNLFVKGQEGKTMNFVQEGEPCVSFILELVDNYYESKVRPSSKFQMQTWFLGDLAFC